MSIVTADSALDRILAWQLTVAWAGERAIEPARLGWWGSSFADDLGGRDLFKRLTPRTAEWAALEATFRAARAVDTSRRQTMANPDGVRTLFFLGYDLDEALANRLRDLKALGHSPSKALPLQVDLAGEFSISSLEKALDGAGKCPEITQMPTGRQLKGRPPADPVLLIERLAAALCPLTDDYPCPFFTVTP